MHICEVSRKQIEGIILWYDNDFYAVGVSPFHIYKHFSQEEPPFSLQLVDEKIYHWAHKLFVPNQFGGPSSPEYGPLSLV